MSLAIKNDVQTNKNVYNKMFKDRFIVKYLNVYLQDEKYILETPISSLF